MLPLWLPLHLLFFICANSLFVFSIAAFTFSLDGSSKTACCKQTKILLNLNEPAHLSYCQAMKAQGSLQKCTNFTELSLMSFHKIWMLVKTEN